MEMPINVVVVDMLISSTMAWKHKMSRDLDEVIHTISLLTSMFPMGPH